MAHDPISTRTAASRVRYLGSAKSGAAENWAMRVTATAMFPLSIGFVCIVASLAGKDYAAARAELGHPFASLTLLLFILVGVYHMKMGMQTIIDDYVHDAHWKDWSLIANLFFCAGVGLACIYAALKLSFV
jgi:succinate dehydrogenase / fumarate reductase membrane anchor subunit